MLIMGSFMLKNIHLHHLLMLMSFNKAITLKHIKWWHILKVKSSQFKKLAPNALLAVHISIFEILQTT